MEGIACYIDIGNLNRLVKFLTITGEQDLSLLLIGHKLNKNFLTILKGLKKVVAATQDRNNLNHCYSNDDCQQIRERNQEYLHRLYTIKLRLGLYERTYE